MKTSESRSPRTGTPRWHRAQRAAFWRAALADGRVLRFDALTMRAYPTVAMRDAAIAEAAAAGLSVTIARGMEAAS